MSIRPDGMWPARYRPVLGPARDGPGHTSHWRPAHPPIHSQLGVRPAATRLFAATVMLIHGDGNASRTRFAPDRGGAPDPTRRGGRRARSTPARAGADLPDEVAARRES